METKTKRKRIQRAYEKVFIKPLVQDHKVKLEKHAEAA